ERLDEAHGVALAVPVRGEQDDRRVGGDADAVGADLAELFSAAMSGAGAADEVARLLGAQRSHAANQEEQEGKRSEGAATDTTLRFTQGMETRPDNLTATRWRPTAGRT